MKRDCAHNLIVIVAACLLSAAPCGRGAESFCISEFMAVNSSGLRDEDGDYSDWVEIHNAAATNVNLGGWFLTDDVGDLQKWAFASTNVPPGGFAIVFASGKNRAVAGQELHANFRLNSGGEYLALVHPDGLTPVHGYMPSYPRQYADLAYGLAWVGSEFTLLDTNAPCRAFVPSDGSLGTNWLAAAGFDDSGWRNGRTAAGYDVDRFPQYGNDIIGLDLEDLMHDRSPTAYIRIPFVHSLSNGVDRLTLRMKYDDGFAAYVNGARIASTNAPGSLEWSSAATDTHPDAQALQFVDFDFFPRAGLLRPGTNMLAIHGLNHGSGSSDFLILPELVGAELTADIDSERYFATPTPGDINADDYLGIVADTKFSVDRGFYTNAFTVAVTTGDDGATIRYTLDGSEPTPSHGSDYTVPIAITNTTALRAAAFKAGYRPTNVDTHTYIFPAEVARQPVAPVGFPSEWVTSGGARANADYEMDPEITGHPLYSNRVEKALLALPTISLVTDVNHLFDSQTGLYANPKSEGVAWERPVSMEVIHPSGRAGSQVDCALRVYGGSSRSTDFPKKTLRLLFKGEYGATRLEYPLFEDDPFCSRAVDAFDTIILRGGHNNTWIHRHWFQAFRSQYIRDQWVRDAQLDMGSPSCHGTYFHLYINGLYWGVYNVTERPSAPFLASYFGGEKEDYDAQNVNQAIDGDLTAWNTMMAMANAGLADNADYEAIQEYLDVPQLTDYMLVNFYVGNDDWDGHNWYAGRKREPGAGYRFFSWDAELCISRHITSQPPPEPEYDTILGINKVTMSRNNKPSRVFTKLRDNAEFRLLCADHIHRHMFNDGLLTPSNTVARWVQRHEQVFDALVAESARWGDYKRDVDSGKYSPDDYDLFHTDEHYLAHQEWLLNGYFQRRHNIVLNQLKAVNCYPDTPSPVFSRFGGAITNGSLLAISSAYPIFYTLDGSDPREYGAGNAVGTSYGGPIALARTTHVKARARDGGEWSALAEAVFTLDAPSPLRVTEIMYNPRRPSAGETNDAPLRMDFEFLELQNTGTAEIGLAGVELIDGVRFEFTHGAVATLSPGERVLVVRDEGAFKSRYPGWPAMHVAGEFVFPVDALADDGEEIELVDGLGRTIERFDYDDDWYPNTDGSGFSLEAIDPGGPATRSGAAAWRASSYVDGSPGAADPGLYPTDARIVISEVLAHQDHPDGDPGDWIELCNEGAEAVGIGGWYLSDSPNRPAKYRIPDGTLLPRGGRVVFNEHDHFGANAPGVGTNGFALSELGDLVVLSSGTNGTLTGYYAVEDFGASDRDAAIGRYVKRDGDIDFTILGAPTPGSSNAMPRVGPVVISEIMYNPPGDDRLEFIELYNAAATNVPLHDVSRPGNAWTLRGAVDFTFPAGVSIPATSFVLVIRTDTNTFRAAYPGSPAGVALFGPYGGQLDNAGESLRLFRPGEPEPQTGEVPEIPVDRVKYNDREPWPRDADGEGASLVRRDLAGYGNDSANWAAAHGSGTPGAHRPVVSLASPANNGVIFAPCAVALSAIVDTDRLSAVSAVEFLRDGKVVASDGSAPYAGVFDVTGPGTVELAARVVHGGGSITSETVCVHAVLVETRPATAVTDRSAKLNGRVLGPAAVDATLFWGSADGGTNADAWAYGVSLGSISNAAIALPVTGLIRGEGYAYRLRAKAGGRTGWSAGGAVFAPHVFAAWTRTLAIRLAGYERGTALTNFPALVRLGAHVDGFDYDQFAVNGGGDLRFADEAGRALNYEIDSWNPAGTSIVWVQVPEVRGTGTLVRAYWGHPAAQPPPCTTNGATWSEGYKAVWHLGGDTLDSVTGVRSAVDYGTAAAAGVAGNGRLLGGSGHIDPVFVSREWYWLHMVGGLTVNLWANPAPDQNSRVFGTQSGGLDLYVGLVGDRFLNWRFAVQSGETTALAASAGQWQMVGLVLDAGQAVAYCDGDSAAVGTFTEFVPDTRSLLGGVNVSGVATDLFSGVLDEVRLSEVARSGDWLWAEHATVADHATFTRYGVVVGTTADHDGDGMPDAWEADRLGGTDAAAGADRDGDGLSNAGEYVAGTDPANAASTFALSLALSNGLPVVTAPTVDASAWPPGSLRYYSLECGTNTVGSRWLGVPGWTNVLGQGQTIRHVGAGTGSRGFYRGRVRLEE